MNNLIAHASTSIQASRDDVWRALTDPDAIRQYFFGSEVSTDWREGSPITWRGEWEGKPYEDHGVIVRMKPGRTLKYKHFVALDGRSDDSFHLVDIELTSEGDRTVVTLTQDHNTSEEAREHSEKNWDAMLDGLKKYLEKGD
ncbi:MAG TPA: SRPBCC family protein [Gemmatimonadaceae bacterium]|nr:SRPBCC family protein [Gemmatimonadaceae bacterium]